MTEMKQIASSSESSEKVEEKRTVQGVRIWLIIVAVVILLALVAVAVYFLITAKPAVTTQIRDVFIIFMALEFMILGVAMVILIIQLAKLVNLLQNEVKPILEATSETINTLKGTTDFLSENLVNPVIKLNSYMSGIKKVLDLLKIVRK
jgi:membrane protein implicated in regulation of membrane protease activity